MCSNCEKSGGGDCNGLNDLGLDAPLYPNSYLMECPVCGAFWMGHGFTPQLMMELTPEEAAEVFPGWQGSVWPKKHTSQ
jgi:hypothetical protein